LSDQIELNWYPVASAATQFLSVEAWQIASLLAGTKYRAA
jgi:hypothetical protein